jgi:hypothetical protein
MSQHDLDVANQGFSAFRTDMNAALAALGTLQSGATAPATTFAHMLWADTTANLLKRRNAANSGWLVLGTLSETFVVSRSSNTILAGSDVGKMFQATAAFTQTLTAAATLGDGWFCSYNAGGFSIVLDPNSSELIDGATTKTVTGSGLIFCNGSAFFTVGFSIIPSASQTFLGADVLLNNTGAYFDGPTTGSIGASGQIWLIIATASLVDTGSAANILFRIWDGTTSLTEAEVDTNAANGARSITLTYLATLSAATTFRLSAKDRSSTSGKIQSTSQNAGLANKSTSITAVRVL